MGIQTDESKYVSIFNLLQKRELRENLYKSYILRGDNDNDFDNKEIIKKMVALRKEKANLMGFETHADYVLDNTMAKAAECE